MHDPNSTLQCRCKQCRALLARRDLDGLAIKRGEMQVTVAGAAFTVAVVCYRCGTLNIIAVPSTPAPQPSAQQVCAA